jgi:hypothetical protein
MHRPSEPAGLGDDQERGISRSLKVLESYICEEVLQNSSSAIICAKADNCPMIDAAVSFMVELSLKIGKNIFKPKALRLSLSNMRRDLVPNLVLIEPAYLRLHDRQSLRFKSMRVAQASDKDIPDIIRHCISSLQPAGTIPAG